MISAFFIVDTPFNPRAFAISFKDVNGNDSYFSLIILLPFAIHLSILIILIINKYLREYSSDMTSLKIYALYTIFREKESIFSAILVDLISPECYHNFRSFKNMKKKRCE